MGWDKRLKTKIEIGKKYKNGKGVIMTVIEENPDETDRRYRFIVKDETNRCYYHPGYTDGYYVNEFGGFGIYPNVRDLVELISEP
jgi:hypothetical protein